MRRIWPFVALLLIAAGVPGSISAQMAPVPLETQVGKSRPLLIFTPNGDPRLDAQFKLLPVNPSSAPELKERQVVIYVLPERMPTDQMLSEKQAAAARGRFHVRPGDFTVILIGKDGGEKFRSNTPVSWEKLSDLIDSMPMRQQEMGKK